MKDTQMLAIEIGCEEIPAFDLKNAIPLFRQYLIEMLDNLNIKHGECHMFSSPRRLIALVQDVATVTEEKIETFRGPAVHVAFTNDGKPTKAALGFAQGKGLEVGELERRIEGNTEYIIAQIHTPAKESVDLLSNSMCEIINKLSWPRSCRWNTHSELFVRPIRWIVALLGDQVIPFEFAGVSSGNYTFGHRVLSPGPHQIKSASGLIDTIRRAYVVPTQEEREEIIRNGAEEIQNSLGLRAELSAKTLTEVVNLTEFPSVLLAEFDPLFLKVPKEIIIDSLLRDQRYFPLFEKDGSLSNKFIIVSNGNPEYNIQILQGNQRVVAARLYDAKFFYEEDLKQPLDAYVPLLDSIVFQEKVGTMLDKTKRVCQLVDLLSAEAQLDESERNNSLRAAHLCKADLTTHAVIEFTSVQGIMGSYYASASGECKEVCRAIAQHYKPCFSGDGIPDTKVACVVAAADKIDTICALFAANQAPTGSSDPFALRRNALGVVAILKSFPDVSLVKIIDESLTILRKDLEFDVHKTREEVINFFIGRSRVIAKDEHISSDTMDAVLSAHIIEPIDFLHRARVFEQAKVEHPDEFLDLKLAYERANNLRDEQLGLELGDAILNEDQKQLYCSISEARQKVDAALKERDYLGALMQLSLLRAPIDSFFNKVLIMDDNPEVRSVNLILLNQLVDVFSNLADFSKLSLK